MLLPVFIVSFVLFLFAWGVINGILDGVFEEDSIVMDIVPVIIVFIAPILTTIYIYTIL